MSTPNADEVGVEELTQEICEQQLVNRFDYLTTQCGPQRGSVVLRLLGFGVVTLVGIDPDEARVRDITVEVAHNGFYMSAKVCLKVRVTPLFAERQRSVPRLGNIWVFKFAVSPNHFTRFYIPGVEDLFKVGDHLVKVEHGGSK
jgi:hypothetical protein